jgi:hypothetical protein
LSIRSRRPFILLLREDRSAEQKDQGQPTDTSFHFVFIKHIFTLELGHGIL